MVHVYDWMLEEHPSINLDYQRVYDVGWVDSETIVVSAGGGGMGLFSAATGELRHSCKGKNSNEYGIGVWDQLTGKQIEFYYDQYGWSLGETNRNQSSSFINLLDFRVKIMIQLWSHWLNNEDDEDDYPTTQWQFRDAIAMEETNSICLVNECGDLGSWI
ncbi:BTB/POZ domain-containing protein [Camellia lanceoleosa]|uniref:BTB/POZ domain-containing protein n=1 Tax=Camellia lanceoleosa TaxID=1840588 RepID=A0ACC0I1H4_9ERIC|nr:BTB/POZ domain-containing protein [Camellia lanceoleosa]